MGMNNSPQNIDFTADDAIGKAEEEKEVEFKQKDHAFLRVHLCDINPRPNHRFTLAS